MALHLTATGIDYTDFSDDDNMGSELLDDYEEGTWSAAWTNLTGSGNISVNNGYYTKIGDRCSTTLQTNPTGSNTFAGNVNSCYFSGIPFGATQYSTLAMVTVGSVGLISGKLDSSNDRGYTPTFSGFSVFFLQVNYQCAT